MAVYHIRVSDFGRARSGGLDKRRGGAVFRRPRRSRLFKGAEARLILENADPFIQRNRRARHFENDNENDQRRKPDTIGRKSCIKAVYAFAVYRVRRYDNGVFDKHYRGRGVCRCNIRAVRCGIRNYAYQYSSVQKGAKPPRQSYLVDPRNAYGREGTSRVL